MSDEVDLLTYPEGEDIKLPRTRILRIPAFKLLAGIRPGISWKKLCCDVVFLWCALRMVRRARKEHAPYQLVHAVEEAVFVGWLIKKLWGIPYLYDMDSSLAMQITDKWRVLKPLYPLLGYLERLAIRGSVAVVPVCDALEVIAHKGGASKVTVLRDISLLSNDEAQSTLVALRTEMGVSEKAKVLLYIGNLERYQGIDLLLESFRSVQASFVDTYLAIIGGSEEHCEHYRTLVKSWGLTSRIHILGPRPVSSLNFFLTQASILVSPRTKGNNTPMKIYSYLHAGIPILATDLPTHTQVLDESVAELAAPTHDAFSKGMIRLLSDEARTQQIARNSKERAEALYTYEHFERTLGGIYDEVTRSLVSNGANEGPNLVSREKRDSA